MDLQILRAIVQSRSEVMKQVEDPEAFQRSLMEDKFPFTDPVVLDAITKSFTNLITYKVSPEAHQRYSVRIHVIEVLRDWLRPSKALESSKTFYRGERVLEFTARILKIYLKNEILLQDDGNIDDLVTLANALMCLLPKNKTFVPDLKKLLDRIASLRQTENSQRLVLSVVNEKDRLELDYQTLERLYVCQSAKLIEEPLMESFIETLNSTKDAENPADLKSSSTSIKRLLNIAVQSPTIFHIASSVLKEILVNSNYSSLVIDYIQLFLKSLGSQCQERNKNVLDLYPLRLESCVLLLNIEPVQHNTNSRDYVLQSLERINASNPEETLILLSHFPSWLQALGEYLENLLTVTHISLDDEL